MPTTTSLGTTDEVDTCDCCGRTGLKSTVALDLGDGRPVHYGVVCAARALNVAAKLVRSESRRADEARAASEAAARRAAHEATLAPWFAWLAVNGRGRDPFSRIASLGGYAAARAAFESSKR